MGIIYTENVNIDEYLTRKMSTRREYKHAHQTHVTKNKAISKIIQKLWKLVLDSHYKSHFARFQTLNSEDVTKLTKNI